LPVDTKHVGWVIVPTAGAAGMSFTVNVYVAFAAAHGQPDGLLLVTVIMTVFPISLLLGVYINVKGVLFAEAGVTEPLPFSVIVTFVALPPKVLSPTVTGVMPQMLPLLLLSLTVGPFTHPVPCPNAFIEINKIIPAKRKTLVSRYSLIILMDGSVTDFINNK
jgi:hypothetical protein